MGDKAMLNAASEIYEEYSVSFNGGTIVFFFNSGLCLNRTPTQTAEMHTHYHPELFTVFRGEMRITTESGTDIVTAGETVIIPAGLSHRPEYSEDIFRVNMAFVDPNENAVVSPLSKMLSERANSEAIIRYTSPHILQSIDRILNYVHGDFDYKSDLIKGCLEELTALLCQNGASESVSLNGLSDSRNYRRYIISATFDRAFATQSLPIVAPTLESLSKRLHLSERQTERTIRSIYGRTFCEQVLYLKMEKARELLDKTDMTVNKISAAIGYSSTRSFFSAFKMAYGVTPSQYRKNGQ